MSGIQIEKEEIVNLTILPADDNQADYWKEKLEYALRLGNEFKSKTNITFNTSDGIKIVSTTVWSLKENFIVLKGGVHIPLKSSIDVRF